MARENPTSQAESPRHEKGRSGLKRGIQTIGLALGLLAATDAAGIAASEKASQAERQGRTFDLTRAKVAQVVDLDTPEKE